MYAPQVQNFQHTTCAYSGMIHNAGGLSNRFCPSVSQSVCRQFFPVEQFTRFNESIMQKSWCKTLYHSSRVPELTDVVLFCAFSAVSDC